MIKISILTSGEKILDDLDIKNATLEETGITLLALKQIEQKLIDMEFEKDIEIREDYKNEDD